MKTLHSILEDIAAIGSTKAKELIMSENKSDNRLKLAFYYAENPRLNFYIKFQEEWIKEVPYSLDQRDIGIQDINYLSRLVDRQYTGYAARDFLKDMLKELNLAGRIVLMRIINKDLRCGAGTALANKVWPKLIPEYPCMLAGKYDAKAVKYLKSKEGPNAFMVQRKCDGGRVNIQVDPSGNLKIVSRAGGELEMFGHFDAFKKFPGFVFDGEVLVNGPDGVCDRKTGNGFFTKAVRNTLVKEEADRFTVVVWDMIPMEQFFAGVGTHPYSRRFEELTKVVNKIAGDHVSLVESKFVSTVAEVDEFYLEMRDRGEEGAIAKIADSVWEDKRSKNMLKLKAVETADLLCVEVLPGKGKYEGQIGALRMVTSDRLLMVDVGVWKGDEGQRKQPPSDFIGNIFEVEYNEVISDKNRSIKCLFLPVLIQRRYDKTVANTLKELK